MAFYRRALLDQASPDFPHFDLPLEPIDADAVQPPVPVPGLFA